jgi:hypothetical protein
MDQQNNQLKMAIIIIIIIIISYVIEKHESIITLAKLRYRWENNIIMELQEVGSEGVTFMERTRDRVLWWRL